MENILFKVSFPAEFHAQTAAEAAIRLHPMVKDRLNDIQKIRIRTQESGMRIINKTGPLHNPADRDHSLQYITAVSLIFGELTAEHYEDDIAKDPRIDQLREKMQVTESAEFTEDYLDPDKRSIANAVRVFFNDGHCTEEVMIEYPIGHKRRRAEAIPLLTKKFSHSVEQHFSTTQSQKILSLVTDKQRFLNTPIQDWMNLLCY